MILFEPQGGEFIMCSELFERFCLFLCDEDILSGGPGSVTGRYLIFTDSLVLQAPKCFLPSTMM